MKVRLMNVGAQNSALRARILKRIDAVLDSGTFILGREVENLERAVTTYLQTKHAIACSAGTDAIVIALASLGIGPGDEVITTPFSFFATVESIIRLGARPRFADINPATLNIEPEAVPALINSRTKAILGVHLYGNPSGADRLSAIALSHQITLVEDAAQAFGARLGGRATGTLGALGCFSFQPTKPLGALGDAGLVTTDEPDLAARCRRLRSHGTRSKHEHIEIGGNYRMDAIQAAVLDEKLNEVSGWLSARAKLVARYTHAFSDLQGVVTPKSDEGAQPSWALYTVRVLDGRRTEAVRFLSACGVETAVYYPLPLHRQPALLDRALGLPLGALPNAEAAAAEVLSIPLYPELKSDELEYVIESVRAFFRN